MGALASGIYIKYICIKYTSIKEWRGRYMRFQKHALYPLAKVSLSTDLVHCLGTGEVDKHG